MSKNVMVVDDDPIIRMLIKEYLTGYGHNVEALGDGKECLESLEQGIPDILILDLQMPEVNGIDVLKHVRATSNLQELPVLLLSANINSEKITDYADVKADHYLEKPFDIREVLKVVERAGTSDW